jgi:hypothetical protein
MKSLDEVLASWSQILDSTDGEADGCNSSRFKCVMNDEAVLDMETGLVWDRSPGLFTSTWYGAVSGCPTALIGGRHGWRLPAGEELMSLIQTGANPALPTGHPFQSIDINFPYWTSTPFREFGDDRFLVVFMSSGTTTVRLGSESNNRWCVRGIGNGF